MMNICVLTHAFPPMRGGFSTYAYEITRHWILLGENVKIVTTVLPNENTGFEPLIRERIIYLENKSHTVPENFRVFIKFLKIAIKEKADVVFLPFLLPYSIFMVLFSYLTFNKFPYVIGCHGADILSIYPKSSHPSSPVIKLLGRMALRRATTLFVISNYTADKVRELGVKDHKIKIFPNGVDYHKFSPVAASKTDLFNRYNLPLSDTPVLLTVSQFNKRKGIDTVIKIVYELKKMGAHFTYLIIGSGEMENEILALIEQLELKDRVFVLKNIDDDTLMKFYNVSDIFLLLSRQVGDVNVEGFGIVFLEANACGLPVIAGNSGGIPDAIDDGRSGFLVAPENISLISEKILYLVQHPAEAEKMGKYGRNRVMQIYNWEKITADMITHLKSIIN